MTRHYFTLFRFEETAKNVGCWYDVFGSYYKRDCDEERVCYRDNGDKGTWLVVVKHEDSAAAMIAAGKALPAPRGFELEA